MASLLEEKLDKILEFKQMTEEEFIKYELERQLEKERELTIELPVPSLQEATNLATRIRTQLNKYSFTKVKFKVGRSRKGIDYFVAISFKDFPKGTIITTLNEKEILVPSPPGE
jgi:hypothetical protein